MVTGYPTRNPDAPSSQKAEHCPISFILVDDTLATDQITGDREVTLYVRPEELTRNDPSRVTTQQTLGQTVWADSFGAGVTTINVSGHTGWGQDKQPLPMDGFERFKKLKSQVFDEWHTRRANAVGAGHNPDKIKLIFADKLNGYAAIVVPMTFTLRRSKSRPLLLQYQIAMTVLDWDLGRDVSKNEVTSEASRLPSMSVLDSLSESISKLTRFANEAKDFIDGTIAQPVAEFMRQTARLYNSVTTVIAAGDAIAESLISIARMVSQAGLNLFRTAAAVKGIPSHVKVRLMQVSGAYSNIFCLLRNAVGQQMFYPDYSPLFGASNCSSTSGGRPRSPLSGVNPWYYVSPTLGVPPVSVSAQAQQGLQQLATSDIVLSPLSIGQLGTAAGSIANGMAFS